MSLNTAHADHGVLIHAGEVIILFSDNVTMLFIGNDAAEFKGNKQGRIYLTTHRMIFNTKCASDPLRSFSFPFIGLQDVSIVQPLFAANIIKGKIHAQVNGNFVGEVKFKMSFKSGGAIEFGTAMLKAAHLASRHRTNDAPPPYTPPTGPWYSVPPPAYAPPPEGYYGWVPPYTTFPTSPPPNSVFVSNNPPPYPGVGGMVAATGPMYPAGGLSGSTTGLPPVASPTAPAGEDPKAAEAARSAYYDPNRPQTAYVPPPYEAPPTYQDSTSKKEN